MLCVIFAALIVVSCVSQNFSDNVTIRQTESDYPVVIKQNKEGQEFILFYLEYDIRKKNIHEIRVGNADYYNEKNRFLWSPVIVYSIDADSLVYVNNAYNNKRFLSYGYQRYVVRKQHHIEKYPNVRHILTPYLEKMKSEHKDTLHIGTIRQLKQTNPELMNGLLQGDSIRFNFVYKDDFHHIELPVEIK